jgi:hypothetical protein
MASPWLGKTNVPAAYAIEKLDPTVSVREAVPGSGDACGSTFLNRIFRKYLENHLMEANGFEDDTLEDAMKEFETITKRKFAGDEKSITIKVPGVVDNTAKGVRRQKLTIQGSFIKELFAPVMNAITALVQDQLKQAGQAKAVIMVGGFGQSAYLRDCIQESVGSDVEILQPPFGWTSVVRGALMKSLHDTSPSLSRVSIRSRRARRAYGILIHARWQPRKHAGRPRFVQVHLYGSFADHIAFRLWDSHQGEFRVHEMRWFVQKVSREELMRTAGNFFAKPHPG